MGLVCWTVQIYLIICVVRVIMSWLPDESGGILTTIGIIAYNLTEPVFSTVRKVLPTPGELPIDFSPAVIIIGLTILRSIVC